MTEKYVDELYGKFSKHIAKKNRKEFKSALEECAGGKYESLKGFEPKAKAPFSDITYLTAWISALFGCIFLVLNLLVFCLLVPSVSGVQDVTVRIISTIMMIFDIILAIILFIYWLGVVLIHRSKAQEENFKALNEIIKN